MTCPFKKPAPAEPPNLAEWVALQHGMGNPWPPTTIAELNLLGPPTSPYGHHLRIALLVQLLVGRCPIELGDLERVNLPISGPPAYRIKEPALSRLRNTVDSIMDCLRIGVRLNLVPIIQLEEGEAPQASFVVVPQGVQHPFGWTMPADVT